MNIAYTICSANYLAQAKVLGDSLILYNPQYKFIIGLVDKIDDRIDTTFFEPHEILPVEDVGIDNFEEMYLRYNIVELNTSVKPFIADYLFKRNGAVQNVIYLDPDIMVYDRFSTLERLLQDHGIVLIPHFTKPIYDAFRPSEPDILNAGLYNLGFIAMSRSEEVFNFLSWWKIRLYKQCLIDLMHGIFVDQLWINFVPLYFNNVYIFKHTGYNFAYWNLHERTLSGSDLKYFVNDTDPLVFFHFSGYKPSNPDLISAYQSRYTFDQKPELVNLFKDYHQRLLDNGYFKYVEYKCTFVDIKEKIEEEKRLVEEEKRLLELKRIEEESKARLEYEAKLRRKAAWEKEQKKLIPRFKKKVKEIIKWEKWQN